MRPETIAKQLAVIGAGPFGLAVAAALKHAGAEVALFGRVMSFWRDHVPKGMTLLSGPLGLSFDRDRFAMPVYEKFRGTPLGLPISAEDFAAYGCWFHSHACPSADPRHMVNMTCDQSGFHLVLEDGTTTTASHVVIAVGMKPFAYQPSEFASLPSQFVSHTSELCDLTAFRGLQVAVIGSGQSALESAALLAEQNARVEVIARSSQLPWRPTGHLEWSARPAPTGLARLLDLPRATLRRWLDNPDVFRRLPASLRFRLLERTLRAAASSHLKSRLAPICLTLGRTVRSAAAHNGRIELQLDDGTPRVVDHVVLGTGFKVGVDRLGFLSPEMRCQIRQHDGYPELNGRLESSIPNLYFVGAAAAWNFGPIMWFVRSAPWCAQRIRRALLG